MDWLALSARLHYEHRNNPSLAMKLELAIREIRTALQTLDAAGHHFHLADGVSPPREWDWPRRYYRYVDGEHSERIVGTPGELSELGPGWYRSPQEAAQKAGEDAQFAGRAGIRRQRGLATMSGEESRFVSDAESRERVKREFLASKQRNVS